MNKRLIFIALLSLLAFGASAQMRMRPSSPVPDTSGLDAAPIMNGAMPGAIVSGKVEAVGATTITLASSLVLIDASQATVVVDGAKSTLASVKVADVVVATLKTTDVAPGAPLPATVVAVTRPAAVTLTGIVQAVDATAKTLTLLGRTIYVTTDTAFGGPAPKLGLADVKVGGGAIVTANVVGGKLTATNVMLIGQPMQPPPPTGSQPKATLLRGTVKTIGADKWVITTATVDTIVLVNSQTKIVGDPKVGDKVDVMATTDSANSYVALVIMKSIFK